MLRFALMYVLSVKCSDEKNNTETNEKDKQPLGFGCIVDTSESQAKWGKKDSNTSIGYTHNPLAKTNAENAILNKPSQGKDPEFGFDIQFKGSCVDTPETTNSIFNRPKSPRKRKFEETQSPAETIALPYGFTCETYKRKRLSLQILSKIKNDSNELNVFCKEKEEMLLQQYKEITKEIADLANKITILEKEKCDKLKNQPSVSAPGCFTFGKKLNTYVLSSTQNNSDTAKEPLDIRALLHQ